MDKLQQLIKIKGFTQYEVAEKLGVTEATVSRWINDKTEPRTKHLRAMSKMFNVSIEELIQ